jgi:hypothetical protein
VAGGPLDLADRKRAEVRAPKSRWFACAPQPATPGDTVDVRHPLTRDVACERASRACIAGWAVPG